jgi:pyruvate/2-oxoglutarate dehydrogenase complex dihydrolipoamide acyltransferase (E2) component
VDSDLELSVRYLSIDNNLELGCTDKHGINVSVNDFVIKAAALALKEVPEANGKKSLC